MTAAADLEQLWHEYHTDIARYIGARTEPDMVDDLVQDVFLRAWSAMLRGLGCHEHARGWLYTIAHNRIVDHYRHNTAAAALVAAELDAWAFDDDNTRTQRNAAESLVADGPTVHELAEQAITCERVRCAVGKLPDNYARAMTLKMEGYEFREIAVEMGTNYGAAKAIGHRAYVKLQVELRGEL